jgi:hypothetical protein
MERTFFTVIDASTTASGPYGLAGRHTIPSSNNAELERVARQATDEDTDRRRGWLHRFQAPRTLAPNHVTLIGRHGSGQRVSGQRPRCKIQHRLGVGGLQRLTGVPREIGIDYRYRHIPALDQLVVPLHQIGVFIPERRPGPLSSVSAPCERSLTSAPWCCIRRSGVPDPGPHRGGCEASSGDRCRIESIRPHPASLLTTSA